MPQQFTNRRNNTVSSRQATAEVVATRSVSRGFTKGWLVAAVVLFALVALRGTPSESQPAEAQKQRQVAIVQEKPTQKPFPALDTTDLTPSQQRMVRLLRQEYAKQPMSYDSTVMKYTEGFKESWCADFISWVRFEAGVPFEHQETGYWRIPGVQTLRDYYMDSDAYRHVGEYTPKFGDVAFYFGETPDGNSREHVAFVLSVQGDTITTIGGNETDAGILQIRTNKLQEGERGLTGFGVSRL
jgi:hypothetical protein